MLAEEEKEERTVTKTEREDGERTEKAEREANGTDAQNG